VGRDCQQERRVAGWRRIAVILDDPETSLMALQSAIGAARHHRARLTIISVVPRPWPTVVMAGMSRASLQAEAMQQVATMVRRLTETVPADVPCTAIIRCGRVCKEILAILTEHPCDLVFFAPHRGHGFLGPAGCRKAVRLMRMAQIDFVVLDLASGAPARVSDISHAFAEDSDRGLPVWALAEA
jgi:hypothetical protein